MGIPDNTAQVARFTNRSTRETWNGGFYLFILQMNTRKIKGGLRVLVAQCSYFEWFEMVLGVKSRSTFEKKKGKKANQARYFHRLYKLQGSKN